MTIFLNKTIHVALVSGFLATCLTVTAGNPERAGQAGSAQLLINPYARSAGWASANTARCKGLESQFMNVAGLAFTRKTEFVFMRSSLFAGSGINVNCFGLND